MPDTHKDPTAQSAAAQEIAELVRRSHAAQAQIEYATQEQVDTWCRAIVWACGRPGMAEKIAKMAVEESGIGYYEGKYLKVAKKMRYAWFDIMNDKSVGIIEEDKERNLLKIVKPVGVIGALSPSTNPEGTPPFKSMSAIKGRNSIIITPHPRAKRTNKFICDVMREALVEYGAPADLIISVDEPTIPKTEELMKQCDRVLATGGAGMVTAAYSSGTPALGVGVGNVVVTVDETADLKDAAMKIRMSKTSDLAASCSSDNSVLLFEKVYDEMLANLQAEGGYLCSAEDKQKLQNVIWVDGHINPKIVAQPAVNIAKMAGIPLPDGKVFFMVQETGIGPEYPFSGEKLSVTLTVYKIKNIDQALEYTNKIQGYQGSGHSCGIHSNNQDHIMKIAMNTRTSRVMIRQPQSQSNSGNLWNGMPQTFSLGCGSWGGNSTNNNINWRDLVNISWVSFPLAKPKEIPGDDVLFGADVMKRISAPVA